MTLKERITEDMKAAMRAGEKERLSTIRMVQAAIKQREVDERIVLDDAQVIAVLEKMVKQRKESVVQFEQGGRQDLADKELAEIVLLQSYLPTQLSAAEVDALINEAIAATGAASVKDMGKVMAAGEGQGRRPRRHGRGERPHQGRSLRLIRLRAGRCPAALDLPSWLSRRRVARRVPGVSRGDKAAFGVLLRFAKKICSPEQHPKAVPWHAPERLIGEERHAARFRLPPLADHSHGARSRKVRQERP